VSSSSSGDGAAEQLLALALDVLEREAPAHAELLAHSLDGLGVELMIGVERLAIGAGTCVTVAPTADGPGCATRVVARCDLPTCLALLDGRTTILATLRDGRFDVRAPVSALLRAAHAFEIFLHGLVRAPSAGSLVEALRRATSPENTDA
jgi:hypothetical protein